MKSKTFFDILVKISNGEENIPSIYDPQGIFEYRYVIMDKASRMGYIVVWCSKTFQGFQGMRLKVPENSKHALFAEELKEGDIPEIKIVRTNRK